MGVQSPPPDVFYTNLIYLDLLETSFLEMETNALSLVDSFYLPYTLIPFESFLSNFASVTPFTGAGTVACESIHYESTVAAYHYSIPTAKLAYPEPFVASASLMHSDLWFVHILIYQYWLWFVFVYLIIFFFVTFVCTIRWCNMRVQPRRETRGVSRSKCGDLITACVPVSWATSIIVHESTDAIDYYDGFGTSEMVVGIRAYQWGWEYYYPRDLDLNYTQRPTFSSFIGSSLRYEISSALKRDRSSSWKYLLAHTNQRLGNLPSLLWLSSDRFNLLPLLTGSAPLWTPLRNTSAFAQTRRFSKFSPYTIFTAQPLISKLGAPLNCSQLNLFPLHTGLTFFVTPLHNLFAPQSHSLLEPRPFNHTTLSVNTTTSLTSARADNARDSLNPPSLNPFISPTYLPFHESLSILNTERFGRIILSVPQNLHALNLFNIKHNSYTTALLNNKRSFNPTAAPLSSVVPNNSLSHYDEKNSAPIILLNKEELIPEWALSDHWATSLVGTASDWYLQFGVERKTIAALSFLPPITPYNEYDFINWQTFSLLEANLLEANLSTPLFDEAIASVDVFFDATVKFTHTRPFTGLARELYSKKISPLTVPANNSSFMQFQGSNFGDAQAPLHLITPPATGLLSSSLTSSLADSSYELIGGGVNQIRLSLQPYPKQHQSLYETVSSFSSSYSPLTEFKVPLSNQACDSSLPPEVQNTLTPNTTLLRRGTRFETLTPLRLPAKNLVVTSQAIQKVAKTRFDELRSFIRPNDFANSEQVLPLITSKTPTTQSLLSKNGAQFSSLINHFATLSTSATAPTSLLFHPPFELPILLGLKSDPGRHVWVDWFAKWGFYEVQPSSTARYAIYGMPYFAKLFDFTAAFNEEMSETENYFLRLTRARRLFQPNWVSAPHLFFENYNRFSSTPTSFSQITPITDLYEELSHAKIVLYKRNTNPNSNLFAPSFSSTVTYSRSLWQPRNHSDIYNFYATTLLDILARREFLARLLLLRRAPHINLPIDLVGSSINPTFQLWDLEFKSPLIAQETGGNRSTPAGLKNITPWGGVKNQYRPLRKGINNLLRLHASNAIALPCELRIQVLASSKDVIHSWAVPSAGIKIDCVPGYSSHKIMLFLLSGIFWGQCMEVCGRYHHWMPIVVYFMKRDMFVLWCTHFVFFDKNNQVITSNTLISASQYRPASLPKTLWA